ncbi:MAG: agmatinase [bacterium]|nr:agmatinase [bacterium]
MPFLGAGVHARPAAVLIGAPYDATSTYRAGSAHAPASIRWASESVETYSPFQQRDLADLAFSDSGDLDLAGCSPEAMVERVRARVAATSGLPVVIGGDHAVTFGAVAALAERHPDLGIIVLDAHLDLLDEYEGAHWSHATVLRRITDRLGWERCAVLGARSGTRDEWAAAASLAAAVRTGDLPPAARAAMRDRPIYLSVDIDVFDPSIAPGTGNPEPLGISIGEFASLLGVLAEHRIVGCDLVEVSPPCDPSGRTSILAAWLLREMLLAFVRPGGTRARGGTALRAS